MEIIGLIMAGGEGSRMDSSKEKPLIPIAGKPMIKHVIESLNKIDSIEKIVVATSSKTPHTEKFAENLGLEVLKTSGDGYHTDMKEAIKKIGEKTFLVISSDLPLIKEMTLKKIVKKFEQSPKSALSTFLDLESSEFDSQSEEILEIDKKEVVPAGVNLIDGGKIDEPYIDQENLILRRGELGLNVNNISDLKRAERILSRKGEQN